MGELLLRDAAAYLLAGTSLTGRPTLRCRHAVQRIHDGEHRVVQQTTSGFRSFVWTLCLRGGSMAEQLRDLWAAAARIRHNLDLEPAAERPGQAAMAGESITFLRCTLTRPVLP